jgi:hypothetical protein
VGYPTANSLLDRFLEEEASDVIDLLREALRLTAKNLSHNVKLKESQDAMPELFV